MYIYVLKNKGLNFTTMTMIINIFYTLAILMNETKRANAK